MVNTYFETINGGFIYSCNMGKLQYKFALTYKDDDF